MIKRYAIVFLALVGFAHTEVMSISTSSIQGKRFSDRTNGIYDPSITNDEVSAFLDALKEAVREDSAEKMSKLLHYPVRWKKNIKTKQEFEKNYKAIMTPKLKNLILSTQLNDLFVNSQGFMIGNGEIWFNPREGIITFNTH